MTYKEVKTALCFLFLGTEKQEKLKEREHKKYFNSLIYGLDHFINNYNDLHID